MNTAPAIYDRTTRERLCFLQNAYQIDTQDNYNQLSTASFSLPIDDPKNAYCTPFNYVEIFKADGTRKDLYRITPAVAKKNAADNSLIYQCEHVLATLIDGLLFGFHAVGNVGTFTNECINYILGYQSSSLWSLDRCDYADQFLYTWENENPLSALYSILKPLTDSPMAITDTSDMSNWKLSLIKRNNAAVADFRYKKNLLEVSRTIDPTGICTRLYPLGYGEGDNQLNIKSVNGGKPYIDSDTQSSWGIISRPLVDGRFQDATSLLAYAQEVLESVKNPYVTYTVIAAANAPEVHVGEGVHVVDEELGIDAVLPVISVGSRDILGDNKIDYTVANAAYDITSSMAEISDRQRITELYSQGSVNIDSANFSDNADAGHPAVLKFFVPDNVVRINGVNFTYSLSAFRAYSKAAKASAEVSSTSAGGGGGTTTSASGGGGTTTSSSGGGTTTASAASMEMSANTDYETYGEYGHFHTYSVVIHSHSVSIPNHTHGVTIPDHTHELSLGDHSHQVTLPAHSHDLEYGIYEGGAASSAAVKVDGTVVAGISPDTSTDITNYLALNADGKIQRGTWHTIEIIPDVLTRIEASIQITLYINPKGVQDL